MSTPSGTGSCAPSFDAGAAVVAHKPVRTGEPGATAAVGNIVSERMNERPAALTPVTILRTLPGIAGSPSRLLQGQLNEPVGPGLPIEIRSEEHTSELQSQSNLVCRLLLEKKKKHNT